MTKDDASDASTNDATTETNQEPQHWSSIADRLNPNRPAFDSDFRGYWKSLSKAARKKLLKQDRAKIRTLKARGAQATASLPFEASADDHCETSPTAYAHIVPILELMANQLDKSPAELKIYDPYYCAGGTAQHLAKLGFPNVHNQPQDFYACIKSGDIPEHDVLVTNPPYSGDHFDRLMQFLQDNQKPFLLLLPSCFSEKPAFQQAIGLQKDMVFMTPPERYHYWTPEGMREQAQEGDQTQEQSQIPLQPTKKRKKKKSQAHRNLHLGTRLSPYASHWFIRLQPLLPKKKVLKLYNRDGLKLVEGCHLQGDPVPIGEAEHELFHTKPKNDSGEEKEGSISQQEDAARKQRKKKKRKT